MNQWSRKDDGIDIIIHDNDVYYAYDVYDDSRRYTNATNTSTSDIMKEMVPY